MARSVVVLPAPLAPIRATISPCSQLERDAVERHGPCRSGPRGPCRRSTALLSLPSARGLVLAAEVGPDDGGRRAGPRPGVPSAIFVPKLDDDDAVARCASPRHVVLDQQHGDAAVADAAHHGTARPSPPGSCRRTARRAAAAWLGGQRERDARARSGGRAAGSSASLVGDVAEAEDRPGSRGALAEAALVGPGGRRREADAGQPGASRSGGPTTTFSSAVISLKHAWSPGRCARRRVRATTVRASAARCARPSNSDPAGGRG